MEHCGHIDEIQASTLAKMNPYFIGINAIYSPLIMILNTLLIAAFIATKQMFLNTSNFLIICLSISDLVLGIIVLPLYIMLKTHLLSVSVCIWNKIAQILFSTSISTSTYLTIFIAIDRYLHMNPDMENHSRFYKVFDKPYLYFLVISVVIFAVSISAAFTMFAYLSPASFGIANLCIMFLTAAGLCIIIVLYTKGYLRIRRFTKNSPLYSESATSGVAPTYVRRLYKTTLLLIIVQMVVYIPTCVAQAVFGVLGMVMSQRDYSKVTVWYQFCGILMFSNSFINSLIVIFHNREAQQWIRNKTYNIICKKSPPAAEQAYDLAARIRTDMVQVVVLENINADA